MVIAGKYDPVAAVEAMVPHLTPSRPFAVYSEFVEVSRERRSGRRRRRRRGRKKRVEI